MNVLILGIFEEMGRLRLSPDGIEGSDDLRALGFGQDARTRKRTREGLGAAHVRIEKPPVEVERVREALEDLRRPRLEAPAPEFHLRSLCLEASART